jgi:RNA polymerase sigma factor (sigma-70 family)
MDGTDQELLQEYQRSRQPEALEAIIRRHVNMVYSAAVRQVHDRHLADDVTQAVFILFTRKAASLSHHVVLPGWLFRTTRNVAVNAMRKEARRQRHEQLAAAQRTEQSTEVAPPSAVECSDDALQWQHLEPLVDEAMGRLRESYRDALVLRFFCGMSMAQVGATMGLSEEAARKLVSRGVSQLRSRLGEQGLTSSPAALGAALAAPAAMEVAPPQVVHSVLEITTSPAGAAGRGSGAAQALAHGTLTMMTLAKIKVFAAVIAVLLASGGVAAAVYVASSSNNEVAVAPTPLGPSNAPTVAQAPVPGTPQATVAEVRAAVTQFVAWSMAGDPAKINDFVIAEKPEYQAVVDAGASLVREGKALRAAVTRRFGPVPESLAALLPGGQTSLREQSIPRVGVQLEGYTAIVQMPPDTIPPTVRLQKVDGRWKVMAGASLIPAAWQADPQKASLAVLGGTQILSIVAETYRQATADVESGKDQSVQDVINSLQGRINLIAQAISQQPK